MAMDARTLKSLMTAPFRLGEAVDLRGQRVAELVDLSDAVIANVDLTGAVFEAPVVFRHATFAGLAWFKSCVFAAGFDCRDAIFEFDARFDAATFTGPAHFDRTEFRGVAAFDAATFASDAVFERIAASGNLSFAATRFKGRASIEKAQCSGGLWLDGAHFETPLIADGLDVEGRTSGRGVTMPAAVLRSGSLRVS
jgi:hypothetical protein